MLGVCVCKTFLSLSLSLFLPGSIGKFQNKSKWLAFNSICLDDWLRRSCCDPLWGKRPVGLFKKWEALGGWDTQGSSYISTNMWGPWSEQGGPLSLPTVTVVLWSVHTKKRRVSILSIKELIPNIYMIFVGSGCSVREYNNWGFYRLKVLFEVRISHQNWTPKSLRTMPPGGTCYFLQLNSSVLSVFFFFSGPQVGKLDLPVVPKLQPLLTCSLLVLGTHLHLSEVFVWLSGSNTSDFYCSFSAIFELRMAEGSSQLQPPPTGRFWRDNVQNKQIPV